MTKLEQAIDCVEALLQYVLQGNGSALPIGDALVDGDYLAGGLYEARELLKAKPVDAVPIEKIARLLADTFSNPCNFSPLDEEMFEVCGENCDMDDEKCWGRWIKLKMDGKRREQNDEV